MNPNEDGGSASENVTQKATDKDTEPTNSSIPLSSKSRGIDQGWAWLIAIAASWITFVTYGFLAGSAVLFVSFQKTFHLTREDASWPISVLSSSLKLSAPVVALLCNYLPVRVIALMGTLATAVAVASCFWVNKLLPLILLFGLVQGVGYAFLSIPAILMVNLYFVRYRTIANGIQLAGGSLGGLVFPPLIEVNVSSIGLHKYFICMAAILVTSICGALLFKRPNVDQENSEESKQTDNQIQDANPNSKEIPDVLNDSLKIETSDHNSHNPNYLSQNRQDARLNVKPEGRAKETRNTEGISTKETSASITNQELSVLPSDEAKDTPTEDESPSKGSKSGKWQAFWLILSHPMFYMIEILGIIMGTGSQVLGQIFVDYAAEWQINVKMASLLISVLSAMDFLGRLGTGWITDFGFMRRQRLLQLLCFLDGASCVLMTLFRSTYAFVIINVYSALAAGMLMPLVHVLQAHYFGAENIGIVIALDEFINGLLTLLVPNILGYYKDTIGSYNAILVIIGAMLMAASFLWFLEPSLMRCKGKSKERETSRL